jgi:hypothetical protein
VRAAWLAPRGTAATSGQRLAQRRSEPRLPADADYPLARFRQSWRADNLPQKLTRTAAKLSTGIITRYFVDEMSSVLDEGKKVTHEKLAAKVEDQLENRAFWKKVKGAEGVSLPAYRIATAR